MDQRITQFLTWGRRRRGWADTTCDGYRRRVGSWLAWCKQAGVRDRRATPKDVRAWLDTLHPSPGVHTAGHTALLAWYDWHIDAGRCQTNPVRQVDRVPVRRPLPRSLDADTVRSILDAAAELGPRVHLYIGMLAWAGLRRAEACAVRWVDIEGQDGWLRVVGKGGQESVLPIHDELRALIVRHRSTSPHPVWCFPGRYGDGPVCVATGTQWARRVLDEAGLPEVTGHQLRHAFARRMVDHGVPLPDVMGATRHRTLRSVTLYTLARPAQVAAAVAALDW